MLFWCTAGFWNGVYHKPSKHLLLYPPWLRVTDSAFCSAGEKKSTFLSGTNRLHQLCNLWGSLENGNMKTFIGKLRVSEGWAQNVKTNMRPSQWGTLCEWAGWVHAHGLLGSTLDQQSAAHSSIRPLRWQMWMEPWLSSGWKSSAYRWGKQGLERLNELIKFQNS